MKRSYTYIVLLFIVLLLNSCFKEIDTVPLPRTIDKTFTVQYPINKIQTFYRFYENAVIEVDSTEGVSWDLAFESAGAGNRVMLGYASFSTALATGKYDFGEITQDMILDAIQNSDNWIFSDPTFVNNMDSVALRNWEDGEIYIQNRGVTDDNYYIFQFVSRDAESYSFRYASALSLEQVNEATIFRNENFSYLYFSYESQSTVLVEPLKPEWDIVFTPYRGWWETSIQGEYAPFNMSGVMINNENGVRVAQIFDAGVDFLDIDSTAVYNYEFIDLKGAIGANWKVLGSTSASRVISVNPDYKYLLSKYDFETDSEMYFKLQILDYYLEDEAHYPLVEFKFLWSK
ncbi:hypothetical protein ACFLRQ_01410 [Bacteroidota bacterium]